MAGYGDVCAWCVCMCVTVRVKVKVKGRGGGAKILTRGEIDSCLVTPNVAPWLGIIIKHNK